MGTSPSAPQAATCLSRSEIRSTNGVLLAGAAAVQAVMPVRLFPRCARRALAVSAAIGRFDRTPHHTGAAEPATAAAPAAPDGTAPAELPLPVGRKRRASSSPDVRLKLLARKGYCAPHACADAQGCDSGSDCTALHCAALRCSALEGTVLRCTASALHCTALHRAAHWQLSPLSTPTAMRALWGRGRLMRKRSCTRTRTHLHPIDPIAASTRMLSAVVSRRGVRC